MGSDVIGGSVCRCVPAGVDEGHGVQSGTEAVPRPPQQRHQVQRRPHRRGDHHRLRPVRLTSPLTPSYMRMDTLNSTLKTLP